MPLDVDAFIKTQLESQVLALADNVKEQVIKDALAAYEKELRSKLGDFAIRLSDYFSVERLGSDVMIHCKITKGTP